MTDNASDPGMGIAATIAPDIADLGGDPNEPDLRKGETVGEYIVDEKIGEGGFGKVFRAIHPVIGKQVAIKVLNRSFSADPTMVSRFIAEARAVNQIRHRNIIDIFSFGQLPDKRQYYVMELLSGTPLDSYLTRRGGRIEPDEALPLLRDVARALDAAHSKGIAHRDLKPENVFISDDDGTPFPKLLDFGIAKLLGDDARQHKTRTGAAMGTPMYMSPEQCRGKDVDHRTDIYSFGIMTYQVLTGMLPFRGEDFVELLLQQTQATATPASQVAPQLPPAIDAAIQHMLEKEPANRPQSLTAAVGAMYEAVGMAVPKVRTGPAFPRSETPSGLRAGNAYPTPSPASGIGAKPAVSAVVTGAPKRGKLVIALIAGLAVAAGIVVVVVMSGKTHDPGPIATPEPPKVIVPDDAAIATAPPPRDPPPDAAPQTVAPATIEVEIKGVPAGTQIYNVDKVLLGTTPDKILVTRSDKPFEITLKHDGYTPRTEKISVATSATLTLPLTHVRVIVKPPTPKGSGGGDIGTF